jgi:hypothetical protein
MEAACIEGQATMVSQEAYGAAIVRVARSTLGVREHSRNRGPEIDEYVRAVGLDPAKRYPWCMAWVYWVCAKAAAELGGVTTCPRTAGAVRCWQLAQRRGLQTWLPQDVIEGQVELRPGDQFIRVRMGAIADVAAVLAGRVRPGHTGIIEHVDADGTVYTIEGNTNDAGSHEGDGVYRRVLDLRAAEVVGFVRNLRQPHV